METHVVKRQFQETLVFSKSNNLRENFLLVASVVELIGLLALIAFGCIAVLRADGNIIPRIIGFAGLILVFWRLTKNIRFLYRTIIRRIYPILVIQNDHFKILDKHNRYVTYPSANIECIKGKFRSSLRSYSLAPEVLRIIFFSEIVISLVQGDDLIVDVINTSLNTKEERASLLELKRNSNVIGKLLAGEFDVGYYWENDVGPPSK